MSRTVTLLQLRDAVRFQADLIGATVRHTEAQLTTLINQSIQGFREEISNDGNTHYLVPYSGTLTTGATSPYSFLSLDLSAISPAIVRTYGLDVTKDNVVHTIDHRPFTERNTWSGPAVTGFPKNWAHYQTAKLAIQPAPDGAYAYTLWYLPVLANLSADGDTFDGVAGWEDWIVWDVVCRLLIRDQQGTAFQIAKTYRDDVWARIKRQATRVSQAGGAVVGRDTLRGRIPDPLAARQAVMAGGGPPPSGTITLDMMADMTGPAVLGRVAGTGRPTVVGGSALAQSILPLFGPTWRGLVPAAGGSSITKFLSQAGTFEDAPGGGGAGGNSVGPSGAIQFQAGTGFAGASGFRIYGTSPSLIVGLDGGMRITGGFLSLGSGTVKGSASGIDFGGGAAHNIASLTADAVGALSYTIQPGGSGIGNETLANMASGTIKASLGLGPPQDISIPTLAAYMPIPTQVGGSTTPGGGLQDVQFNNGNGGFAGASGLRIVGSGVAPALVFGNPAAVGLGDIRFATGFDIRFADPSGAANLARPFAQWLPAGVTGTFDWGSSSLPGTRSRYNVGTGGEFRWWFGAASATKAELFATGFDLTNFHVAAKSLSLGSGVANDTLAQMASGTVKTALSLGIPGDVQIPTLAAYFPTFTANRAGLVAPSDGDTSKFLNAAGGFSIPAGAGGTPTGVLNSQLANMPPGTVKANLSGTAAPSDIVIPTLMAFFPTFTANAPGIVPPSGGGTTNFLRADGAFAAPPAGGTPTGIGLAQLGAIASPRILGRVSTGSGIPEELIPTLIATLLPVFTTGGQGVVPGSGGGTANYLRADATFAAPSGAHQFPPAAGATNEQLASVPSGTVKGRLSAGVPTDLLIPTLFAFAPTMTSSRAGIVGPGGGTLTNFLRGDGLFAAPTGFTFTPTGLPNANLAPMPSGTVKVNLSGTAAPQDILIPTLAAFFPTFTANRAGLVAPGDGDTNKFLNAAGAFATPPGGSATPGGGEGALQYNVAGTFTGQTGLAVIGATGVDMSLLNLKVKSIDVGSINGLPFNFNSFKRGADIKFASGLSLFPPRGAATGANRYIVPSGIVTGDMSILLRPSGARGGEVIRVERIDSSGFTIDIKTPTGTTLHSMPSGTKAWADFMYTKPSGPNFELAGHADMF